MHKLISIAALTAVLAASASAQAKENDSGFYAGVVLGYSHTDFDLEAGAAGVGPTQYDQTSLHAGEFGFVGGYHQALPRQFFVELEAEGLVGFGEQDGLFGSSVEVERNTSFALAVKPGYELNEKWNAFITLGAQWVGYKVKNPATGYNEDDSSAGFLHGLGVDYKLDEEVSLTLEYVRVQPLDVTYQFAPGIDSRFDPEVDSVKLALKYHF